MSAFSFLGELSPSFPSGTLCFTADYYLQNNLIIRGTTPVKISPCGREKRKGYTKNQAVKNMPMASRTTVRWGNHSRVHRAGVSGHGLEFLQRQREEEEEEEEGEEGEAVREETQSPQCAAPDHCWKTDRFGFNGPKRWIWLKKRTILKTQFHTDGAMFYSCD